MDRERTKHKYTILDEEQQNDIRNNPWRTVAIYTAFGFAWILFSDRVLELILDDHSQFARFQTFKGWFYVLITAALLYILIRLDNRRIFGLTRVLSEKNDELTSFSEEMIAKEDELEEKINQLNQSLEAIDRHRKYIDEIFNSTNTFILLWNLDGDVINVNDYFLRAMQYTKEEMIGKPFERFIHPDERFSLEKFNNDLKRHRFLKNLENRIITKYGVVLDVLWNDRLIKDPTTNVDFIASFGIDITNKKANENKIHDMAFKDRLTGLKNRAVFETEINYLIGEEKPFAIIYLDFDNFKNLNEVYGHDTGDLFLIEYASKLVDLFVDFEIYRWSGDEFILLQLTNDVSEVKATLEQLMKITKCRWTIGKMEYYPSLSAGVSRFPEDGDKASDLLKNVELALYKSKESGKSQAMFYEKRYETDVQRLVYIENAISGVLQEGGFELYYQPIYELDKMSPMRFEALLRWKSSYSDINTGEFIEVAEKTGQILDIDRWVIKNAFVFSAKYFSNDHMKVSVNLSAKSLKSPTLIDFIVKEMQHSGVNPSLIEFEITEHSLIDNFEFTLEIVNTLKDLGFSISLDDFGTRYSSLDYLRKIPFDTLKIDKSYIDKLTVTGKDRIIVEQIIHLANQLGLTTVAEGIETMEQKMILRELGCKLGQGYLMSRPINQEAALEMLEQMR